MLERLRYVRLPSANLPAAVAFARDIVGLEVVETTSEMARFRSDERAYTLEYNAAAGAATGPVLAIEVRTSSVLDEIQRGFAERGLQVVRLDSEACRFRRIHDGVACCDHSGNQMEIVVRAHNKGRRSFPTRDAGITSFSGVALRSTAIGPDISLWCDLLNAEVRDYVGSSVYLGFDSRHHRISLHPSSKRGLLSVDFEVEDLNCIMQSQYFISERQIRIVNGPGREPFSGKIFLSFAAPDETVFTYATGMSDVNSHWRPRQYSNGREFFCNWGSPTMIPELLGK